MDQILWPSGGLVEEGTWSDLLHALEGGSPPEDILSSLYGMPNPHPHPLFSATWTSSPAAAQNGTAQSSCLVPNAVLETQETRIVGSDLQGQKHTIQDDNKQDKLTESFRQLLLQRGTFGNYGDASLSLSRFLGNDADCEGTFYSNNMGNFNGIGHDVAPSSWPPLCKTSKLSKMKDRTYMRFSVEDTLKLIEGVKKFGRSWKSIKSVYFMDSNRTKDQLKEKWKHMMKSAHKQSDPFLKKLYMQSVDIGNNVPKPSEIKPVYHNRKICYKRKRSQRDYPSGKRKIYDICGSVSKFGGNSSNGITSSPGKGFSCDASASASGILVCVAGQQTHFQSRDSNVKIRIKSFKVPEFFIEIPEFATVGSLKRIVMEAVAAKLGGELRVGVLIHGKKIRDDNKTLLQTGISHDNKLDALGFSLEPNPSQALPPVS